MCQQGLWKLDTARPRSIVRCELSAPAGRGRVSEPGGKSFRPLVLVVDDEPLVTEALYQWGGICRPLRFQADGEGRAGCTGRLGRLTF